ncbi:MAG: hypothetical protein HEQ32_08680 [Vampirovibrio sp.]
MSSVSSPSSLMSNTFKSNDWFQPLDDSPNSWVLFKHLIIAFKNTCLDTNNKVGLEKPTPLMLIEEKKKSTYAVEVRAKAGILSSLPPSKITIRDFMTSPYNSTEDFEEQILQKTIIEKKNILVDEHILKEQKETLGTPILIDPLPLSNNNSDLLNEINRWISLNIDEHRLNAAEEKTSVSPIKSDIVAFHQVKVLKRDTQRLQKESKATQAEIESLISSYFGVEKSSH